MLMLDNLDDIGIGVRNSISGAISATYDADTNRLTVDVDPYLVKDLVYS